MIFTRSFNTSLFISSFLLCFAVSYNDTQHRLKTSGRTLNSAEKHPFLFGASRAITAFLPDWPGDFLTHEMKGNFKNIQICSSVWNWRGDSDAVERRD